MMSDGLGSFDLPGGDGMWAGYQTLRWRRLRLKALRRDGYMCSESKRYGLRREATTVHHIWPAEDYPEYAWSLWNLLSVTAEAHGTFHDKHTGRLTPKGEYWRRKVTPPPSASEYNSSL